MLNNNSRVGSYRSTQEDDRREFMARGSGNRSSEVESMCFQKPRYVGPRATGFEIPWVSPGHRWVSSRLVPPFWVKRRGVGRGRLDFPLRRGVIVFLPTNSSVLPITLETEGYLV